MAHHEKYLAYSPDTSGNVANCPHFSEKKFNLALGIVILAVLVSTFLLVSYYTIITKYFSGWNTSRRGTASTNNTEEDDDHTQSPIHNIWYVRNVGLEESVINSITICKYKRGEGLVDGAECSVCLNGFHEDENLRILPKCSHAFHLSCIDMWLKSHVNCPLCRTNVVSTPTSSGSTDLNSVSSHSSGRSLVGNSQNQIGFEGSCSNAVIGNRSFVHPDITELEDSFCGRLRAYSDLVDKNLSRECVVDIMDDDIQPFQRSVSMDSSSSLLINIASANFEQRDSEGSSTATGAQWMGNGNSNWVESLDHKRLIPKHRRDRNLLKMLRNCSKGSLLQKGPVLMKRSFSSGNKTLLTRYRRTRNSLLPL